MQKEKTNKDKKVPKNLAVQKKCRTFAPLFEGKASVKGA